MTKNPFIRQKRILYGIIGVGIFLLLSANILAWIYLQRIKTFFVSDLKFRLENVVRISGNLIIAEDLEMILPGQNADLQVIHYQQIIYNIKNDNNLQDIYILSPSLEILIDVSPDLRLIRDQRPLEPDLTNQALAGNIVTSELLTLGKHKFLIAICPLYNTDNMLSGLLVIEARAKFFDVLEQFNRGLLAFSALNVILILSVAFLLFRSVKKGFQLQNQINNQEHLVKLGEMAASVAHELRNPLGIIKGTHSLIHKKYGSEEDEFFTFIPAELDRLNKLIEEFLLFARNKPLNIQSVDIAKLTDKIKLGFSDRKQLIIDVSLEGNFSNLKTDSSILEQILLNIIKNSAQAVNYIGKILLTTRKLNKKVIIQVADNGPGIENGVMDKIFEPFFSTKEKGSGLGLSISKKLVEQLEGEISIQSQNNHGTTVTILLPVR